MFLAIGLAIKVFTLNILNSFHNEKGGYSARKLAAFFGVMLTAYLDVKHTEKDNLVELSITWLSFSLLCLGIITAQQIIDFKTGKKQEPPTT